MEIQANRILGEGGIVRVEGGISVDIRLPWYRSLPLSTIEVAEVSIDGEVVAPERITFELEGKRYPLNALEEQTGHVWFVLDSAFLAIADFDAEPGSDHEVSVTLVLYPPYIHGLKRPVRDCRKLTLKSETSVA